METQQLFVFNSILDKYKKKYIYGIDDKAELLFEELCARRVYIDGFIDDDNAGMYVYHKKVYELGDVEKERETSVLLKNGVELKKMGITVCWETFVINPMLYGKRVVIYGAGMMGEKIYAILRDAGIDVIGFVDSDQKKVGQSMCGKCIYGKEMLARLDNNVAIVETGKSCYEIDIVVRNANAELQRFMAEVMPLDKRSIRGIWIDQENRKYIGEPAVMRLAEYCTNYQKIEEIILYGSDLKLAEKCAEVLACLDFGRISFMTGHSMEQGIPGMEEIVYKENYLLLLYDEKERYPFDSFVKLGVERKYCGRNILVSDWYFPDWKGDKLVLDVNMGHTYETNWSYPGIYIYGENKENDYKIAVLGGSTTESQLFDDIQSWVEIMYKKYCRSDITVFNGGMQAYHSAHELGKLTRDIMKLNPDMIIVYDGFNDCAANNYFQYLEKLVRFAGEHIDITEIGVGQKVKVWSGIPSDGDYIDDWLHNIEYMHAIADIRNIHFLSFMQPSLGSKKNLDLHSKTILYTYFDSSIAGRERQFRERAEKITKTHSYMYDLTHIFDDEDVYMDMAHVYEKGNRIIADNIWNVIKDKIGRKYASEEEQR